LKASKILDQRETGVVGSNGVEQNEWIVLPNVVVGESVLIRIIEALESGVWETFLVLSPRDSFSVQQVHDCGDIGRNGVEIVIVHAEVITSSSGAIVGLRRMCDGPVVGKSNTLSCKSSRIKNFG
jgi:hypothetical protein